MQQRGNGVMNHPPHIAPEDRVILFDGVCKLCNAWSRFLIRYDRKQCFKLCSVQSNEGQAILAWFGYPTETFETMLLVEGNRSFDKSEAFLRVVSRLPAPWHFLRVLRIIPRLFRDWFYDRIALNRYRLFGRYEHCVLPTAEDQSRFVEPV